MHHFRRKRGKDWSDTSNALTLPMHTTQRGNDRRHHIVKENSGLLSTYVFSLILALFKHTNFCDKRA